MRSLKLARALALAATCLAAACGQTSSTSTAKQTQTPAGDHGVVLNSTQNMPDWLLILRTSDGGFIHFNQRAISRENGVADIWLQVTYGQRQFMKFETDTTERTIYYTIERMHYRFDCAKEQFKIVERQIMGANDQIEETTTPDQDWRAITAGGPAAHAIRIACHGA